jgi:MFS family permease
MNLTKKRWAVLVASCLVNLCIGSLYAWSVYATPMTVYLGNIMGNELTSIAIVFTIANAVGPITMISGGYFNDKLGPKWVIIVGGVMFGAGMIISGFAKSLGMLIFSYGILLGLGVGLVYGCTVSNTVKFFPDKRGFIGGIATASYGVSSVLIPPVANKIIEAFGVSMSFKLLGAVMLVTICASAFFIIACPKDFKPEGWNPPPVALSSKTPFDRNWTNMLKDPIFYVMLLMLMCGAFSGLMAVSQASPVAQRMIGMSTGSAAVAVSLLALFNAAGRVIAGIVSDKIGCINTLSIVFVLSVAGLLMLFMCGVGTVVLFYAGISMLGICFGSLMGVYPGFTATQYGTHNNSVNYGIMFIGFALAGYFGPTIMSNIYAATGSYKNAFLIAVALSIAGLLLTFVYRKMSAK